MAGVNHTEYGEEVVFLAEVPNFELVAVPHTSDIFIREAHFLRSAESFKLKGVSLQGLFHINNALDSIEEEGGNLCNFVNLGYRSSAVKNFGDSKDIVVAEFFNIVKDFLIGHIVKFRVVEVVYADFKRADTL